MFRHKNAAVNGLFPGLTTTRSVANQGLYEIEVIIQPVSFGGGGYVPTPLGAKPDRYKVTVRVTVNGRTYEESKYVDDLEARVMAKLYGINTFNETATMVSVNGVQLVSEEEIIVAAKLINK